MHHIETRATPYPLSAVSTKPTDLAPSYPIRLFENKTDAESFGRHFVDDRMGQIREMVKVRNGEGELHDHTRTSMGWGCVLHAWDNSRTILLRQETVWVQRVEAVLDGR
jgi:hypothetical protein